MYSLCQCSLVTRIPQRISTPHTTSHTPCNLTIPSTATTTSLCSPPQKPPKTRPATVTSPTFVALIFHTPYYLLVLKFIPLPFVARGSAALGSLSCIHVTIGVSSGRRRACNVKSPTRNSKGGKLSVVVLVSLGRGCGLNGWQKSVCTRCSAQKSRYPCQTWIPDPSNRG